MGKASRDHTANEDKMTQLETIPINGIIYNNASGEEIGSITVRHDHIAFIAGNWCKQVHISRIISLKETMQEHEKRMFKLLSKL